MEIGVKQAKNQLSELVRRVEAGETVTITRDGEAVADIVKHAPKPGKLNWDAFFAYKRKHGLMDKKTIIPDDFDDPLPEDFLITINSDRPYKP